MHLWQDERLSSCERFMKAEIFCSPFSEWNFCWWAFVMTAVYQNPSLEHADAQITLVWYPTCRSEQQQPCAKEASKLWLTSRLVRAEVLFNGHTLRIKKTNPLWLVLWSAFCIAKDLKQIDGIHWPNDSIKEACCYHPGVNYSTEDFGVCNTRESLSSLWVLFNVIRSLFSNRPQLCASSNSKQEWL